MIMRNMNIEPSTGQTVDGAKSKRAAGQPHDKTTVTAVISPARRFHEIGSRQIPINTADNPRITARTSGPKTHPNPPIEAARKIGFFHRNGAR